jgi:hypothetical protein
MQQPRLDMGCGQSIRAGVVETGEMGDRLDVGLPGPRSEPAHEHRIVHVLA